MNARSYWEECAARLFVLLLMAWWGWLLFHDWPGFLTLTAVIAVASAIGWIFGRD